MKRCFACESTVLGGTRVPMLIFRALEYVRVLFIMCLFVVIHGVLLSRVYSFEFEGLPIFTSLVNYRKKHNIYCRLVKNSDRGCSP